MAAEGVTKEKTVGLHGIRGEQETADGGDEEEIGAFEDGGSGMAPFGSTIADEETGNVALDETLIEIGEQVREAHFGPTALTREETDEGVKNDKTGINALYGLEEAGEVFWEGEGTSVSGMR
jgi:hypothetical protein